MSTCDRYLDLISAELDHELSAPEQAALRAHLETCESCRRYRDALHAVSDTLQNELEAPPAALARGVMARVRASDGPRPKAKRAPSRFGRAGRLAALAAVLALVIWAGFRTSGAGSAAAPNVARYAAPDTTVTAETAEAAPAEAPAAVSSADSAESSQEEAACDEGSAYTAAPEVSNGLSMGLMTGNGVGTPRQAEILSADGDTTGLTDPVALDFLMGEVLTVEADGALPETAPDYTVSVWFADTDAPQTFSMWTVDGALYWRAGEESSASLSPVAPEDFFNILG